MQSPSSNNKNEDFSSNLIEKYKKHKIFLNKIFKDMDHINYRLKFKVSK